MAPASTPPRKSPGPARLVLLGLLLFVGTILLYAPVREHGFSMFDDREYVVDNLNVQAGWTGESVRWAFTSAHASNWHPLTWLSHMLDVELFGDWAGGHHWTSVVLHGLNAVLLFTFLCTLSRAAGPSILAAALFAFHPIRVESVAWIAERKDVLSGLFFFLTLLAYAAYSRRGGLVFYLLTLLAFLAGLGAKPMLVTVPFLLLLLDVGMREKRGRSWKVLVLEKLPMLGFAAGMIGVTLRAQAAGGAINATGAFPLVERLANVPTAYLAYVGKFLLPVRLAAYYPHPALTDPEGLGTRLLLGSLGLVAIALVSWGAWRVRRRQAHLFVGWFWFLGMLVPVIGFVQAGAQQYADRYQYLPGIGLILALVWGTWEALTGARQRNLWGLAGVLVLILLAVQTSRQIRFWKSDRLLFEHALEVTNGNFAAHNNVGVYFNEQGDYAQAIPHFEAALALHPNYTNALVNLGRARLQTGDLARAEALFRRCIEAEPLEALGHFNLGLVHSRRGEDAQAEAAYGRAIEVDPSYASSYVNRSVSLARLGELDRAIDVLLALLRVVPGSIAGQRNLGLLYAERGDDEQAVVHLRGVLSAEAEIADRVNAMNGLAWVLATSPEAGLRDGREALRLAAEASALTNHTRPEILSTWAAAHAEVGEFDQAVEKEQRARELSAPEERPKHDRRLELYRAGRPLRR